MRLVQVNYAYDARLTSPAELLDRYTTLTGWGEALQRAGVEVLTIQRFHSSANVTRAGVRYAFGALPTLLRIAFDWRPDVVHVNGLDHPTYIGLTSRVRLTYVRRTSGSRRTQVGRLPIVVQDHAGGLGRGGLGRAIRRRLLSGVDAFLFSTLEQTEPWRRAGLIGANQRVYDVMEASTDVRPVPREQARSATGIGGAPAVLWVGRLNANKDPLTVLDGFERFAEVSREATLTMVFHETGLLEPVRARVRGSAVLRERVRLTGEVRHDRMAAFYSAADIFVTGSHHEGSGYAVLEAIACGAVPAVTDIAPFRAMLAVPVERQTAVGATSDETVTSVGRTSDVRQTYQGRTSDVRPTYIGRLWTPGDADGCARALDAASRMDRQRVIAHFDRNLTWDAVGRRAVAIYEDVIRAEGTGQRAT